MMNRKERYYLLRWALGSFDLSPDFLRKLGDVIGLTIPEGAYSAMDYHLNWIYAALVLSSERDNRKVHRNPGIVPGDTKAAVITGNQEDIDLIVAFEEQGLSHLVMIEAKGVTSWSPKQLSHKAKRLREIFTPQFRKLVVPHFVIASPLPMPLPPNNEFEWPDWMRQNDRFLWVRMPVDRGLFAVTRSNDHGVADANGEYWTLKRDDPNDRSGGWVEAKVDQQKEHLVITYEDGAEPLVRIARGSHKRFVVEYESSWNDLDEESRRNIERELYFYLIELQEPDPWSYARYHCGTTANAYSSVHWGWVPERAAKGLA